MKSILSKISAPLLVGSILALGFMAYPGHADAGEPTFVFRLQNVVLTAPTKVADNGGEEGGTGGTGTPGGGSETSSGEDGDGTGTPSGGGGDTSNGGVEKPAFDGHFYVLRMAFSGGWSFECETGNWHNAPDLSERVALLRSYKGGPAVSAVTKQGGFSFRSDAYEFEAAPTGAITSARPGEGLGSYLPPCYEPYPGVEGDLWRVTAGTKPLANAGLPSVTTRELEGAPVMPGY